MRYWLSKIVLAASLLPVALADRDNLFENENYRDENFRPDNITGLQTWLYGWRGSYYNGTVTMRMKVVDWTTEDDDEDDKPCDTFLDKTLEVSYDAVLAITKPLSEDENPVMLILTPWQKGMNLTVDHNSDYPWWNLPFRVLSVPSPPKMGYPVDAKRTWNLTTSLVGDSSYSLAGAYRFDPEALSNTGIPVQFNHSSCSFNQELYAGGILAPANTSHLENLHVQTPQLRGQFDNSSASLSIDGFFAVNAPNDRTEGMLAGPVTVDFLGSIDRARSDDMLKPVNDTPMWDQTLGFKRDMNGEVSSAARVLGGLSAVFGYTVVSILAYSVLL
ncbi:hypothetical protein FQN50_005804 [Emmonsiellopsis sp. PD_5]|nr:hypothetical protein FQN50_005804 [Emmonsiellopsis sp. PD_5]